MKNWQQQLRIFFINHPDLEVRLTQFYTVKGPVWRVNLYGPTVDSKAVHTIELYNTPLEAALQQMGEDWDMWQTVSLYADGRLLSFSGGVESTWWPEVTGLLPQVSNFDLS